MIAQFLTAQQMHVQVRNGLRAVFAAVADDSESVRIHLFDLRDLFNRVYQRRGGFSVMPG